ncbi:MAG: hypothetical protein K8R60_20340 [Burkholderiales bacterium]|nr:hypothetical protein [Burkholderiales bacterium]
MLRTILYMAIALLLMALFTTWVYRKMHSGRFADDAVPAPAQVAPEFKPPQTPIELRPRIYVDEGNLGFGITLLLLTIFLFTVETVWLRLLAWPAGGLALLFAGMSFSDAWNEMGTRFVADPSGLQIHDRKGMKTVPWSRVARVRLRQVWVSYGSSNFFRSKRVSGRSLELLDASGASLLKVELPLRSAEDSKVFEASVPVWTQRTIEVEEVGN